MLKKILVIIILVLLIIPIVFAYCYFGPRYTFKVYGYHDFMIENEHSEWLIQAWESPITPLPDMTDVEWWNMFYIPNLKKVNLFGSPYQINIWHNSIIEITQVDIMKDRDVVLT